MSTQTYRDEFRIHPSARSSLPDYLIIPIDKLHEQLARGHTGFCEIEIAQAPHHYSVQMSAKHLAVSTSLNGETDTVTIRSEDFEQRGGLGDILLSMVSGGALPERSDTVVMTED